MTKRMAPAVPKIISYADANDIEGVKKCIDDGGDIDEQRQVTLVRRCDN